MNFDMPDLFFGVSIEIMEVALCLTITCLVVSALLENLRSI